MFQPLHFSYPMLCFCLVPFNVFLFCFMFFNIFYLSIFMRLIRTFWPICSNIYVSDGIWKLICCFSFEIFMLIFPGQWIRCQAMWRARSLCLSIQINFAGEGVGPMSLGWRAQDIRKHWFLFQGHTDTHSSLSLREASIRRWYFSDHNLAALGVYKVSGWE